MPKNQKNTREELLKEYRVKIKVANQRLRELEKLAKSDANYENVLEYAYRVAGRDIKELGIGNLEKVRYRVPKNTNKLKSAINRVDKFLSSPTSTKTGIKNTYEKNAKNFNAYYGTNFTWQELKTFMDVSNFDELKNSKSYNVLNKVIKSITKNNITSKQIQEANEKHKTIHGMDKVQSDWTKRLVNQGLNIDMLLSGTAEPEIDSDEPLPFD